MNVEKLSLLIPVIINSEFNVCIYYCESLINGKNVRSY